MNEQRLGENRLGREKSPYLLQHANNPVHWYPWCREAFQHAAEEDKPVFLSIGYSTCHWCHVMARESFEDAEAAAALNRDFICIKVDREERPDVDAVYMAACQAVTGSGGWPLTAFLTPDQKPFFLGTYFPKHSRYGQPGLLELLAQVAALWKQDRSSLLAAGERLSAALAEERGASEAEPDSALAKQAFLLFQGNYDAAWGGFGSAPKFPSPHNLSFLLRYSVRAGEHKALDMAARTLEAMSRGGICDHIGGGFSRYSTDEKWLVPHFEKMLYDNALLALSYLDAFQLTKNARFADVVRRTLDYVLRELSGPDGGFCCGQDADSGGEEGLYYLLTPDEVAGVLGKSAGRAFCQHYGITPIGNFEGKSVPNLLGLDGVPLPAESPELQKLYRFRRERIALHRDDKVLLSWNAWTICALARASHVLPEERYLAAALDTYGFLESRMTGPDGRLFLRWRDGQAAYPGQLEDYAVYALALLELYETTLDPTFLSSALLRGRHLRRWFEDPKGGYFLYASDAEQLIARPKETYDGAMPSGNSAAAMVLLRLARLTGEPEWQEAADLQLRFLAGAAREYPAGHSYFLLALLEALTPSRELLCCTAGSEMPEELAGFLRRGPQPGLSLLLKTPENAQELGKAAPFTESYPLPEQGAAYYLCRNGACSSPQTDFSKLKL